MFTEYGTLYGILLILILAGGALDLLGTLRIMFFQRENLNVLGKTGIKWFKIIGSLFFGGLMAYIAYFAATGRLDPPMSQMMFTLHLTAAILMLTDFILSIFLKIKYGSKKQP
jgi:ABC-type transporter Mla maintaining outer membrane lipid asymmetry permease subunit MlaE